MKMLALEFSSARRSVAVLEEGRVLGRASEKSLRDAGPFALIDAALIQAGLEREAIETLVVGLGPGSYTGIRSAIALAQGWQVARPIRLLGVSSIEVLAAQARSLGIAGRVHILVDAQRAEFYAATYETSPTSLRAIDGLRLISAPEADARAARDPIVISPDLAARFPNARAHLLDPDAAALGLVAHGRTDFIAGEQLEPIYLRPVAFVKAPPPRVLT